MTGLATGPGGPQASGAATERYRSSASALLVSEVEFGSTGSRSTRYPSEGAQTAGARAGSPAVGFQAERLSRTGNGAGCRSRRDRQGPPQQYRVVGTTTQFALPQYPCEQYRAGRITAQLEVPQFAVTGQYRG